MRRSMQYQFIRSHRRRAYGVIAVYALNWMYMGQDGDNNLWLINAYWTWASPFDVTSFNPLQ